MKRASTATTTAAAAEEAGSKRARRGGEGEDTRVYVGNLSFRVDEEAMRKHFGGCGRVRSVDFITDRATGKFYGTAFVEFDSASAARKALALNGQKLLGRPVKVERPKQHQTAQQAAQQQQQQPSRSVFVSRLPRDVDEDAVWEAFGRAGEVVGVRWVDNQTTSKAPCACGFVEFADEAAAAEAVALFNGVRALGSHGALRVNLAPDRPYKPKVGSGEPAEAAGAAKVEEDEDEGEGGPVPVVPDAASKPKVIVKAR